MKYEDNVDNSFLIVYEMKIMSMWLKAKKKETGKVRNC